MKVPNKTWQVGGFVPMGLFIFYFLLSCFPSLSFFLLSFCLLFFLRPSPFFSEGGGGGGVCLTEHPKHYHPFVRPCLV